MKYDPDKMRLILLEMEKAAWDGQPTERVEGMTNQDFRFHSRLLYEAGYIHADDLSNRNAIDGIWYRPRGLTYSGVEFLEAIRGDTTWERIKAKAAEIGTGYGPQILERVAKFLLENHLPLG